MTSNPVHQPLIISEVLNLQPASASRCDRRLLHSALVGIFRPWVFRRVRLMIRNPIAALFTGSAFMSVVTTSALAITIGSTLVDYQGDQLLSALVTLVLVIGVVQLAAGLLLLGYLVRYVSNALMTGFLGGLGVLIVLSQLGDLTGYSTEFSNQVIL